MKIFSLVLILLSLQCFAQLEIVSDPDLMPEVNEEDSERKLEVARKEGIHKEMARIVVESQMGRAIIDQRLKEDDRMFQTPQADFSKVMKEYSRYSQLVNSLSHLFLQHSIDEGANPVEKDSTVDCQAHVSMSHAQCETNQYLAVDELESSADYIPKTEELDQISEFIGRGIDDSEEISVEKNEEEERNLVILTMASDLKAKADRLEKLIADGLVEEISLKGIAMVKKSFAPYQEAMGKFATRVSEVNNYEAGTCDISPGDTEFYCLNRRYVLVNDAPIGQSFTETLTYNDRARFQNNYAVSDSSDNFYELGANSSNR